MAHRALGATTRHAPSFRCLAPDGNHDLVHRRTVVALWQLQVFRHWVAANIRSLESLGYAPENRKEDAECEGKSQEDKTAAKDGTSSQERTSPLEIADSLKINDLIMDNRLSEGDIKCILQVGNSTRNMKWIRSLISSMHWLSCIWYFPRLLFAICRSRFAVPGSQASHPQNLQYI